MSKKEQYEEQTVQLLMPIIEENSFELVDVEYVKEAGNWYLRCYIDKPGGITINDCELVSRALSDQLDAKDYIADDSYILEVSSPGLGRPLKKEKDFARSIGAMLEVKTYQALNGQKEFTGILQEYSKDTFTIEKEGEKMIFNKSEVAMVRLALDF